MVYLERFTLPSDEKEADFLAFSPKGRQNGYDSKYPFMIFRGRELPTFECSDITILCGNNGSGKSTILNVIAAALGLSRSTACNRSDFFDDYVGMCHAQLRSPLPRGSRVITSDDVFDRVLSIRRLNDGIDDRRAALTEAYLDEKQKGAAGVPNLLAGIDDFEQWKERSDARRKSKASYLRTRLVRNLTERSNGESALSFFVDAISERALYLLDEPENSLSPENQLELKYFLEDAAAREGCQFLLSTHSPFLLSLRHARIYDLDRTPPALSRFEELPSVKVYWDFFRENEVLFED